MGMSRFARKEWIENTTDYFHPSEFWCEIFDGEHLSVDFRWEIPDLIVLGEREPEVSLYRWTKWEKVKRDVRFPDILNKLKGKYEWINCEFIGDKLIEVHIRRNPDFRYSNSVAIPVWDEKDICIDSEYRYVKDEDFIRKGFLID